MSDRTPRARVINFRLSDTEYESIVFACHAEGVRTISDFAREIVLNRARGETVNRAQISQWLLGLSTEFSKLKADIAHVLEILESQPAKGSLAPRPDDRASDAPIENSGK